MTTTVSITTHDWPTEVTQTDAYADEIDRVKIRVEPNSTQTFYITDSRTLHFRELPRENS